jgi:hypothetical protein
VEEEEGGREGEGRKEIIAENFLVLIKDKNVKI